MRTPRKLRVGVGLLALLSGCAMRPGGAGAMRPHLGRDSVAAGRLDAEGLALVEPGRFPEAEGLFRSAIAADAFSGPAHCNLGLALLAQNHISDAALALRDDDPAWNSWARRQLTSLKQDPSGQGA